HEPSAKLIERVYAQAGADAEVINLGVGNSNTTQEVQAFLTTGQRYRPDIIVLNYFVNDAEPLVPTHLPSALMRFCASCVFIAGRIDGIKRKFLCQIDYAL